ncbi:MAG: DEAD/DEAH box helicase family protein, partial [Deltaproteobacteria bacterium]|nr:DEAD/DEAH box helicase family protein [Deltaproteobacteria bacterium]
WAVQCKFYQEGAYISKQALDSFLSSSGRTFRDDSGSTRRFSNRLWVSTTNNWSAEAAASLRNQAVPCATISLLELQTAPVDWEKLGLGLFGHQARLPKKSLLGHQKEALQACSAYFKDKANDRGKLIMACGTGKTFASLRIAEQQTNGKGLVLFLAPSIALIGQTLNEWSADALSPLYAICVCSDPQVSRSRKDNPFDADLAGVADLALPATTDVPKIVAQLKAPLAKRHDGLRVIFSTYQSIDKVSEALKEAKATVDFIVCDEAHRTTGVTLAGEEESHFVKVHDDGFIKASKRLYMTATPRVYGSDARRKAEGASATLCSMDDESLYGQEIYRLGFGEAVDRGLLSDYKVLVLTVNRNDIFPLAKAKPAKGDKGIAAGGKRVIREAQAKHGGGNGNIDAHDSQVSLEALGISADGKKEIDTDDVTKLIGCVHALSKDMDYEGGLLRDTDPGKMRSAVAFCQTIPKSMAISDAFNRVKDISGSELYRMRGSSGAARDLVNVASQHVDGTMGAAIRDAKTAWLKANDPKKPNECRVLTNVRCLSEGVDVPILDAVMFLSGRNSQIDVVQSVGRVMRKAPGKKYGYIVISVVIPNYVEPEEVLGDHESFGVVWTVLNALKSHDDRFQAEINKINFNAIKPDGGGAILVGGIAASREESPGKAPEAPKTKGAELLAEASKITVPDLLAAARLRDSILREAIYARLVKKVGSRQDMSQWADDVAKIAKGFQARITRVVNREGPHKEEFDSFLKGLRQTLNPYVDTAEAIEMLAQHLITKPVFEALFENYSFVRNNPVSQSLEAMIDVLEDQGLEQDRVVLGRFYQTVKSQVAGIDNAAGRQAIIVRLYDNFFKRAMPKAVDMLGIVYTPVEIVDFIVNSVAKVLEKEFGRKISDDNVHILDPFTGTGTFIARLIQSGLLGDSLQRKYLYETHANEITLLAYYIASINIENAYHGAMGEGAAYHSFDGICLTDTFQLYEDASLDLLADSRLQKNTERVEAQKNKPIMAIIGNPPYSVGQRSAHDNAQNQSYPMLEKRIAETYAARSTATNRNSLYDSYVKAFRWASDRLSPQTGGIVAFVSNAGWVDGNAMAGMRKCLAEEFNKIYVFNLRGNQRTSGELSRKEGGKIFGSGSRTPIAITLLVKTPASQKRSQIYYCDIGDYLSREEKLAIIADKHDIYNPSLTWDKITPNDSGDWINKRNDSFETYVPIGDKNNKSNVRTFFLPCYSNGLKTNRDPWCYNSSKYALQNNIKSTINFYNQQVTTIEKFKLDSKEFNINNDINYSEENFSWGRQQKKDLINLIKYPYCSASFNISIYRPYFKQNVYFSKHLTDAMYSLPKLFPTQNHENLVICIPGPSGTKDFMPLITENIPDIHINGDSQCFPRYYYEEDTSKNATLFKTDDIVEGYSRHDAITDYILGESQ